MLSSPDLQAILLVAVPALLGVAALVGGILLLRRPREGPPNSTLRTVIAVLCLVFALGALGIAFALGLCVALTSAL